MHGSIAQVTLVHVFKLIIASIYLFILTDRKQQELQESSKNSYCFLWCCGCCIFFFFLPERLLYSCCENVSVEMYSCREKKSHISYFLTVTFHFQFPKSKLDISFKPNDTVAGCSLKLSGLHSDFIPLAILCHAVSTGSPFGEEFSAPTHAFSISRTCIHRFPNGCSFHSQCKGMAHGFSFSLHML